MIRYFSILTFLYLFTNVSAAVAQTLKVEKVTENVWALIGPAEQRDSKNVGNNATFGLIKTSQGAVLIDPGGSLRGAAMIDAEVRKLTTQPIAFVINTGGQDHRWIGNSYWRTKGAKIIAANAAVDDQKARASIQMTMLSTLVGDEGMEGTEPVTADITSDEFYNFELGGTFFEVRNPSAAHTPGDSFVWLPDSSIVFTGDIVYVGRVPGVMEFSNSAEWLTAFEAIEELQPEFLVPGHGPATSLSIARADTYEYLVNLREKIRQHIDDGGEIINSVDVDQSAFKRLDQFEALSRRNAQAVYEQMEWE